MSRVLSSFSPRLLAVIMFMARPYLRLHLAFYSHTMARAVFPRGDQTNVIAGPDPDRILFVGEIGVAGYGVLLPEMAMPARVAARHAAETRRGCTWDTVAGYDMTAAKAASVIVGRVGPIDVAVVSMGIPDVLMVTSAKEWSANLSQIIAGIRAQAGSQCRVVLTGIPPMDQFQPIPPIARKLIGSQVDRLNQATARMECSTANVVWAPFPELTSKRMRIREAFSFKAMHTLWAEAIAPHLVSVKPALTVDCTQQAVALPV